MCLCTISVSSESFFLSIECTVFLRELSLCYCYGNVRLIHYHLERKALFWFATDKAITFLEERHVLCESASAGSHDPFLLSTLILSSPNYMSLVPAPFWSLHPSDPMRSSFLLGLSSLCEPTDGTAGNLFRLPMEEQVAEGFSRLAHSCIISV